MSEFLLQLRWNGRFGNRMFQYAYGATYARVTGLEFWLPAEWEGTSLFRHQPHGVVENNAIRLALTLPDEGAASNQQRLQAVQQYYPDAELIDTKLAPDPYVKPGHPLCHASGCAYNKAVFTPMSNRHLQHLCEFSEEVRRLKAYKRYFDIQGLYDVAHLRRDDISDVAYNRTHVQGYSVVSKESYRARSGNSAIRQSPSSGSRTITRGNGMLAGTCSSLAGGSIPRAHNTFPALCSTGSMTF